MDTARANIHQPATWPRDGGEMGALVRAKDWSKTPIGAPQGWSPSLKMMVGALLANRFPLLLWWGPDYVSIYNDAYRPVLGAKHPWALGQPVRECWAEIWDVLKPLIDTPFNGGPATWMEDLELEINRHGFVEETHFTVAYSPVPDDTASQGIGGVLATVHEITDKVIGARRIAVLGELGTRAADASTTEEACTIAAETLSAYARDLPFALLYLIEPDRKSARLAGTVGIAAGEAAAPGNINLDPTTDREHSWPLAKALDSEATVTVENLGERFAKVPVGPWPDPAHTALVVPIASNAGHRPVGFLVTGVSPRLKLDTSYRGFFDLVAAQIATAIANARAYEEERRRAEALAEIDRAKTAFFANVSHEFRTPLTLMLGPLEAALAASDLPAAERERLEVAHRNSLRLLKLVNSLLDFSRIEAGRAQASFEPTDLAAFTADLASNFRSACERAGLTLTVDCPPLPEPVHVDRDMWEKIVLNLLSNAFKFTFEGEIAVSLRVGSGEYGVGSGATEREVFSHVESELSRPESLASGHGSGGALLRGDETFSARRAVRSHESDQKIGGVHSGQHSRGTREGTQEGISEPSEHRTGIAQGAGNAADAEPTGSSARPENLGPTAGDDGRNRQNTRGAAASDRDTPDSQLKTPNSELPTQNSFVTLTVRDTGVGISEDELPRLFERFHRIEGQKSRTHEGSGIGLALVQELVKLNGGAIRADSAPGRGTAFTIDVPFGTAHLAADRIGAARAAKPTYLRAEAFVEEALRWLPDNESGVGSSELGVGSWELGVGSEESGVKSGERAATPDSELTTPNSKPRTPDPPRVLVADDNADMRSYLRRVLGARHAVETVADGKAALESIRARRPDLVLADVMMPGLDGFGLLHAIRAEPALRGLPVILLSARAGEDARAEGFEAGADDYLVKPFSTRELNLRIEATLKLAALRDRTASSLLGQKCILEMIASGLPLAETLDALMLFVEAQESGTRCGILLVANDGFHFRRGGGPHLPEVYHRTLDGVPITPPYLGSCGEAAHQCAAVLVPDIAGDTRYTDEWRNLMLACGLRAVRSTPVRGADGRALASLAIYYDRVHDSDPVNPGLVDTAAHLAAIAIERAHIEESLRESETRHAFLLKLSDALRPLGDAVEIQVAATRALGGELGASRVCYGEMAPDEEHFTVRVDFTDGVASVRGSYRLSDFGELTANTLREGRVLAIADVHTDPRFGEIDRRAFDAIAVRAHLEVPLIKGGRLVTVLSVHQNEPREWTPAAIALAEEVAERTWAAVGRARAETKLRESEEQLRLATEIGKIGLWGWDPVNREYFWPPRVRAMFGIPLDAPVSMDDFYQGLHPHDRERAIAAFADTMDPAKRSFYDVEYRAIGKEDGVTRWVAAKGRGIFDEQGRCVRVLGTAIDISVRKQMERHRELLIHELNHRVKNTLATVQSLAMQSLRSAASLEQGRASFDARLIALSKAHDVLASEHWAHGGLHEIVAGVIAPYSSPGRASRFDIQGPQLQLQPRTALALAMALHELATNAVKYGALSGARGRVAIHWEHGPGGENSTPLFHLSWKESGGPRVAPPKRHGFGSRLIEQGLTQDLGDNVELRFEPSGLICKVAAPLAEMVAREDTGLPAPARTEEEKK